MWTKQDIEAAQEIYARNIKSKMPKRAICRLISERIGRSEATVRGRLQLRGTTFAGKPTGQRVDRRTRPNYKKPLANWHIVKTFRDQPDSRALEDRDRRADLLPTSTTALLCGDPLPGRSALDQKLSVNK